MGCSSQLDVHVKAVSFKFVHFCYSLTRVALWASPFFQTYHCSNSVEIILVKKDTLLVTNCLTGSDHLVFRGQSVIFYFLGSCEASQFRIYF